MFGKKEKTKLPEPQIRSAERHPFSHIGRSAEGEVNFHLYRDIREAVPVIDAAILKLVRLCGGVKVRCGDSRREAQITEFLRTVPVGRGRRGIEAFLDSYMDSLLTYGRAVGEIVCDPAQGIRALLPVDVRSVAIAEGSSPLDFALLGRKQSGETYPLSNQELLLFTPLNPEPENPYGVSLLRSMPFYCDILLKIYHTIGLNWDRVGNVRFAVTYNPGNDLLDRGVAKDRAEQIAEEWRKAMAAGSSGSVRDFVGIGDVDIKVIGADNQILDSNVPVRQILEQLIARTGIPPFMLGMSWATTERMSAQQADMLTSELEAIRRTVAPAVERIVETWMRLAGVACPFEVDWEIINLQDEIEGARAKLIETQTEQLKRQLEGSVHGENL
ncbi:phage portal protein [Oscillospiraceae bacterium OttesenSCG-928-F05]|nr:phage portal protein [Oscillospiraceae bacterium OttesenSCG-928-F05]